MAFDFAPKALANQLAKMKRLKSFDLALSPKAKCLKASCSRCGLTAKNCDFRLYSIFKVLLHFFTFFILPSLLFIGIDTTNQSHHSLFCHHIFVIAFLKKCKNNQFQTFEIVCFCASKPASVIKFSFFQKIWLVWI